MDVTRKLSRANLKGLDIDQLRRAAAAFDPPIKLKTNATRAVIARAILKREEQDAKREGRPPVVDKGAGGPAGADVVPARPEFEEAAAAPSEPTPEGRGGARPGAGRPAGMTDEKVAARNLAKISNVTIHKAIYLLGQAWANSVQIPAVAFDEQETDLLALPLTHIHDRYFPGLIPEMGHVFVALLYGIHQLVVTRMILIKAVQAKRKEGVDVEAEIGNQPKAEGDNGQAG